MPTAVAPESVLVGPNVASTVPPSGFVFPEMLAAAGTPTFKTLHQFGVGSDAAGIQAKMIDVDGVLYGTSHDGGTSGNGTVFTYDTATDTEHVLYSFQGGSDGTEPESYLIDVGGTLYGTTSSAQESGSPSGRGNGTVFSITTAGVEHVLHSFAGAPDGAVPEGTVTDVDGLLYGTTYIGGTGSCNCGTVFSVDPTTGNENVVYSFKGGSDGQNPRASLDYMNGVLYGTTYSGGKYGAGTLFAITTTGSESVLHSFGANGDGQNPQSGLISIRNAVYGTTNGGGKGGVVFRVTPSGKETVIGTVCCGPEGGLVAIDGTLYGTTSGDGSANSGNVFAVPVDGGTATVVHSFNGGTNGGSPEDGLTFDKGALYGTTRLSGTNGKGTLFKIRP